MEQSYCFWTSSRLPAGFHFFHKNMVVFFNFIKPSERKTEQTIPLQRTSDGLSRGGGFDGYFAGSFGGVFFHPSTWWHFFCWWINIGFTYLQECGGLEIAINHRNYTVIDFSEIEWGFFHTIFFFGGGDGYMELFCWRVFPGWWHGQSILLGICRYDICNLLRYDC